MDEDGDMLGRLVGDVNRQRSTPISGNIPQESLSCHRVNLFVQRKALRAGVDKVYSAQVQITKSRSH